MKKVVRFTEILLGVLFVVAAVLKALDMNAFAVQVSLYGVVRDPALVKAVAWCSLAAETALGIALLARIRLQGLTVALTSLMLLGFTGLIAYAWKYQGLADCGCFGKYVPMSPAVSIGKNVVMLLMTAVIGAGCRRESRDTDVPFHWVLNPAPRAKLLATLACVTMVALPALSNSNTPREAPPATGTTAANLKLTPFAQFQYSVDGRSYDLGKGEFIVAMLSATCDRCRGTIPAINNWTLDPDLPPLIGLMLGDDKEIERFRQETRPEFPTQPTKDALTFFQFIGKEPPRFFLIRDGKELTHWDETPPSVDAIQEARKQTGATTAAT